jgi:hypothetical protein
LWISRGGRVSIDESGPISKATAVFSGNRNPNNPEQAAFIPTATGSTEADSNGEVPTDRFEIRSSRVDVSVFALPLVELQAQAWVQTFGDGVTTALFKKQLEDAAKEGIEPPFNLDTFPVAKAVYQMLARGQDTFPTTRISLSRIRTYSATYSRPTRIDAFPSAYRTSSLVQAFNIPLAVASALPLDPPLSDTPKNCTWAWYRDDHSQSYVPKNNHVEEHSSWVFGAIDSLVFKIL